MSAPRNGKYSTFSEALSDVQAKHEELPNPAEEQAEQLRLKEEELNELRRQMAKFCQTSSEIPSGVATDSKCTGEGSEFTQRTKRMPAETLRDALSHLDRFSIDAAQIVGRRFRFTVEEMLSGVCLRQLDSVEMHPVSMDTHPSGTGKVHPSGTGKCDFCPNTYRFHAQSKNRTPKGDNQDLDHEASPAGGYAIRYGFSRTTDVSGSGTEQEQSTRTVTFQRMEDASEYLLGMIRSATFNQLTLRSLTLRDEFFAALVSVAPTVFVKSLTLQKCDVSNADAGIFQHALLQFPVVKSLAVGHRTAASQISNEFLEAAVGRKGSALTELLFEPPVDEAAYHATDSGILRFLFQPTEKKVTLHLSRVAASSTFCAQLFQYALANPARNYLELKVHHFGEREQEGLEAYHRAKSFAGVCYGANAPLGMRLTLIIDSVKEDHSLVFRREELDGWGNEW